MRTKSLMDFSPNIHVHLHGRLHFSGKKPRKEKGCNIVVSKDKEEQTDEKYGIPKHRERGIPFRETPKKTISKKPFLIQRVFSSLGF